MATNAIGNTDNDQELWRNCAKWLTDWGMFKPYDKCSSSRAEITDLEKALCDGVIICELLNKIYPGCIDLSEVSQKPTVAQFLCLRNINIFLKCCREKFGLNESDLFEDHMLSDLTNFHQVLRTLSKISNCQRALRTNICGFSVSQPLEEEDTYETIPYCKKISPRTNSLTKSIYENILPEEIYSSICSVTHSYELEATPASVMEKRSCAIRELVDTEKQYVDVLSAAVEKFMVNLREYLKPDDVEIIFFKMKSLFHMHLDFLCELLKINNINPFIKVSNVFLNWNHKFLVYGPFCANLTKTQKKLEELCRDDEIFYQVLTKCETEYSRLRLEDILKFPVNRFLQYQLLLERITKYTPPDHEEYNDLQKARNAMLELNEYINEMKGDSDKLEEAEKLQSVIQEWNYDPTLSKLSCFGRLLKDDLVRMRSRDGEVLRNRNIFIMDTFILVCKKLANVGPNQFAYRNMINIAEYYVRDDGLTYQFYLEKRDRQMRYTIYVRSNELKAQIMEAITAARAYIHSSGMLQHIKQHRFQLTTFHSPEKCASCSKYLRGLIYQGYKCDECNLVVHKTCFSNSETCGIPKNVKEKLWFVGEMDRVMATDKLKFRESGTFLVRLSSNDGSNPYRLSLKIGEHIYHFKVFCINNTPKKYYLIRTLIFENLIEMVHYYQTYSLGRHFARVQNDAKLLWPFKQLRAIVIKRYDAADILELSVLEGQCIKIIATDGYFRGFWKGRNQYNEIGYFPMDVVKVEGEVEHTHKHTEDGYVSDYVF